MTASAKRPSPDEEEAARRFAQLTGWTCRPLDAVVAVSGAPDFEVSSGASQLGTLEVTRAIDQATRGTQGVLSSKTFDLTGTSHMWHVQIEPTTPITGLLPAIQAIVDHLERAGEHSVNQWNSFGKGLGLAADGIRSVIRGPVDGTPRAGVIAVGSGGPTSRDVLAEVIEREVANNANKLVTAPPLEGHLWIWLEWDEPRGADAMAFSIRDGLPGALPRAPVVKAPCPVWLAVTGQHWALRSHPGHGWKVFDQMRNGPRLFRLAGGDSGALTDQAVRCGWRTRHK